MRRGEGNHVFGMSSKHVFLLNLYELGIQGSSFWLPCFPWETDKQSFEWTLFDHILRTTSHTGCREGGLLLAQRPDTWLCFPHSILSFHSRKKCLGGRVGKDPNAGQEMGVCSLGLSWVSTAASHHLCLKVHSSTAHSKGQFGAAQGEHANPRQISLPHLRSLSKSRFYCIRAVCSRHSQNIA